MRARCFSAIFLGVVLSSSAALALDPTRGATQYTLSTWQTEDGLPQNTVQTITQTKDGYLWVGTQEGLVRFDGLQFTVFDRRNTPSLPHNMISTLLEDR